MIIVAESGSTKCDWLISHNEGEVLETHTMGFNPFFHQPDEILSHLKANEVLSKSAMEADAVYFYGAGCSSAERNEVILTALRQFFTGGLPLPVLLEREVTAVTMTETRFQSRCLHWVIYLAMKEAVLISVKRLLPITCISAFPQRYKRLFMSNTNSKRKMCFIRYTAPIKPMFFWLHS